jgi:hypothetical protein
MRRLSSLFAAVVLSVLGLVGAADAQAPEWSALVKYGGGLGIDYGSGFYLAIVYCNSPSGQSTGKCHPEGTMKVTVSAAAQRRLGIHTATIARGVLVSRGLAESGVKLKIPAAIKPRVNRAFNRAREKCNDCGFPLKLAGHYSVTLTGPAGMPNETLGGPVTVTPGRPTGWYPFWTWTSNYTGEKPTNHPGAGGDGSDG